MKGFADAAYRFDNLSQEDFVSDTEKLAEAREREIDRILGDEADLAEALDDAAGVFASDVAWFYLCAPMALHEHDRRSPVDFAMRIERAVGAYVDSKIARAGIY